MCGIVGYVGKRDCVDILIDSLSKLEYRGYDSAGIAVFEEGKIVVEKSKGRLVDLQLKMQDNNSRPNGVCGIGHTRWATHGEPSDVNSHPHGNKRVSIVHNGIIENYKEIKQFLENEGYIFESQTDTETVAKLLDYYYEGDPLTTIIKTISEIRGSYALGIIFSDFPNQIFAVRKDSPLIIGLSNEENYIASDVPAILKYTRNYYLLESNEIAVISSDNVNIYDIHKRPISKEVKVADWDMDAAEKGGFKHFMLKEIYEQPNAIATTILPRIVDDIPDLTEAGINVESLKQYKQIFIVACGTAMHAGVVGKYVIERMARVQVHVDIASEFRYRNPILSKEDLCIVISQSGETADTLAALKLAKQMGAKTLAIVNVKGSSIAREADNVIYTHAGPEISVASTKAYSVQLAVMYLFAFELAFAKGQISKEECKRLTKILMTVPEMIETMLYSTEACKFAASRLINSDSLLYIGRGLDYALSMEGSLKLKEISYIHSETYAAGELKHGTISLVTEGMPVIAVVTQNSLKEKTISNIKEVKARGAKVIMICDENMPEDKEVADFMITIPCIEECLTPILACVPLQLVAYYTSVLKGLDVDKPRNLAKSVTVE